MSKTAMQELIEYLKNNALIEKKVLIIRCEKLLELKKQQIIDAYGDGLNAHRTNFCNRDEYYNLKFKDNEK